MTHKFKKRKRLRKHYDFNVWLELRPPEKDAPIGTIMTKEHFVIYGKPKNREGKDYYSFEKSEGKKIISALTELM